MADEESGPGSDLADGTLPGEGASEHLADSDGSAPYDAGLGETSGARVAPTQLSTAADPQISGDESEPPRPESGADTDDAQPVVSDTGDGARPAQTESGDGGKPPRHGVLRRSA